MLLSADALQDLASIVALLALISVAFGTILRASGRWWIGQTVLGLVFGGAAALAISQAIHFAEGIIVDMRLAPVALSGAFAGPMGAAIAAAIACAMRISVGGAGMIGGCVSVIGAALMGLLWAHLTRGTPRRGPLSLALLGAMTSVLWGTPFLPPETIVRYVTTVWPVLMPMHIFGVFVVGLLIERERSLMGTERHLAHAASRDSLTGLLNRRGFEEAVSRVLDALPAEGVSPAGSNGSLQGPPRGSAVLILDLDHFKAVNDTWGHAAGDAVLAALGERLGRVLRSQDVLARFGGEEVVAFLPGLSRTAAEDAARRLCAAVREEPFRLADGQAIDLTASVGAAWADGRVQVDSLLVRADLALYAAKGDGRDCARMAPGRGEGEDRGKGLPVHRARHPAPDLPGPQVPDADPTDADPTDAGPPDAANDASPAPARRPAAAGHAAQLERGAEPGAEQESERRHA